MAGADDSLAEAYARALRGDLRGLVALRQESGSLADAGAIVLWVAQPDRFARPSISQVQLDGPGAVAALALHARIALLEFDRRGLETAVNSLRKVPDARADGWADLFDGYGAALLGDGNRALTRSESVSQRAPSAGWSELTVEGVLLRAVAQMTQGNVADAIETARRASRMAQTEHLWLTHFFASVVLARLRRLSGRPHLAGLIATACLNAAPPLFGIWLRWEQLFAGVTPGPLTTGSPLDEELSRTLTGVVTSKTPSGAPAGLQWSALHRSDFDALRAVTSRGCSAADSEVENWRKGVGGPPPGALVGLLRPEWSNAESSVVVVAEQPGSAQRVLGFAAPNDIPVLAPMGARPARPEALVAALALAGPDGVDRSALFASVYGFAFRKNIHEPSFKVVRHQARKLLADRAQVVTEGERVRLVQQAPFAIADPRCQPPLHDALLRYLVGSGGASAQELAARVGVSVRTVQAALREMTGDGACQAEKIGRRVAYRVEDTTFCELTTA